MSAAFQADFPVRNVSFEVDQEIPRAWHSGRRAVTLFLNNLSTLFPLGERFFIQSVRRYMPQIDDMQLRAELLAFCGQEGIHTREHLRYNDVLKQHGYDVDALEVGIARLLGIPRLTGPMQDTFSLAITVALEHWTGLMAHFVLDDTTIFDGAHPVMAALWRWHAAEECEHKAVTFDLYERVGLGYTLRLATFFLATTLFWLRVAQQQIILMQQEGIAHDHEEWGDLVKFLFVEQRFIHRLIPLVTPFFSRDFHPWHLDETPLLDRWQQEYDKNPVYKKRVKKQPRVRFVHPGASS